MPHLYKYLSPSTAITVLTNRTLRWSTPPTLNDPFDMQFAFQIRNDFAAVRRRALDIKWDHYNGRLLPNAVPNQLGQAMRLLRGRLPHMTREQFDDHLGPIVDGAFQRLATHRDRYNAEFLGHFATDKIFCLSRRPDIVLMWSHYASNHAGAVFRFTTDTHDNPFGRAQSVNYVDEMPSLYTDDVLARMLGGYGGLDSDAMMNTVVLTKSAPWQYEEELRIYSGRGRTDGPFEDVPFGHHEIDGVIFGARTTAAHRAQLTALAGNYPRIELLKAIVSTEEYGVGIVPV